MWKVENALNELSDVAKEISRYKLKGTSWIFVFLIVNFEERPTKGKTVKHERTRT